MSREPVTTVGQRLWWRNSKQMAQRGGSLLRLGGIRESIREEVGLTKGLRTGRGYRWKRWGESMAPKQGS